jgi:polyhydroxyalkanoate synthesis regulator phasin
MTTPYTYTYSPDEILAAMQNQGINNSIYSGTTKVLKSINDTTQGLNTSIYDGTEKVLKNTADSTQFLNAGIYGLSKDVSQATLGLRDAVERGNLVNAHTIERTSAVTQSAIERNGGESRLTTTVVDAASRQAAADQARDILRAIDHNAAGIASAVERNGNAAQVTSERINGFLASAIDRNGNAAQVTTERIGGTINAAIERNAGENRLTTTVTDAASREAAAGQARDLAIAIERNGANGISTTQTSYSGLLGTIERNAGETRLASAIASGVTDNKLTDVRHAILNDVNRGTNEILAASTQNLNALHKAVTDNAWESRMGITHGFANTMVDALKSKGELSQQSAQEYASMLLDNQKLAAHGANQYASLLLEQQKMKEYLASKGDTQFAMNQLEMQKVKEGLACQAAQNFSISQLEAQKSTALISAQLADAKYEALKSQQLIVDKMGECCCEVKEKIDLIDRDRLRDNLVVEREDNNLLKILEFTDLYGGRGGRHHGRHHGRR